MPLLGRFTDFFKRRSRRSKLRDWDLAKGEMLSIILGLLVEQPWWYQWCPSFLQLDTFPKEVVTATLYFPYLGGDEVTQGLIIEFIGPEYYDNYSEAKYYLTQEEWKAQRSVYLHKKKVYGEYLLSYLILHPDTKRDQESLKKLISSVTGT